MTTFPISAVSAYLGSRSTGMMVPAGRGIPFAWNQGVRLRYIRSRSLVLGQECTDQPGVQQLKHQLCGVFTSCRSGSEGSLGDLFGLWPRRSASPREWCPGRANGTVRLGRNRGSLPTVR